ncbi:MAG: hypothetical protein BWZ07_01270 [Alphaproteobacteria bacterium ADurb.BinA280]|jgi:hypothetical protein|nr:pathogenicity-like protein [Xanthomonadales bacterium]MCC6507108.1 pathogenicity-like protein [Aquimonas sp.]OPZ12472.1 MAG: hypothetical protein BWZ07_01270 [Alphaproteobacteria bacterium ADurb.BinA280]
MRQIFSSRRLENVEAVADLLQQAGIDTWVSERRSYKGNRRGTFSYREEEQQTAPAVWIVNAADITRARALLTQKGLIEAGRSEQLVRPDYTRAGMPVVPKRPNVATRLRIALVAIAFGLALWHVTRLAG